ncbi:uncharacterized protein LOC124407470 [Diprion similis]|uniref:uncharacterized protein LOC124407470 n=1 Tax=Diprion similis TaxID=362088 RepID=UPI001EF8046F|nr:uncharacterized protein LOC124407470 [Diprion similis]
MATFGQGMPNKYQRQALATRGKWTEESLKAAINALKNGEMSVYAAAKAYQIPRKTLEMRFKNNNDKKGPMGPTCFFGDENERKLANHIKVMQAKGFPLTIDDVRKVAYLLAEQLNLNHRFNKETGKAGYDFVRSFLSRHPDIAIRKSEGVSLARSTAMNKAEVDAYFKLLENVLTVDDVMLESSHIFNMDETGLQLNNRPGYVLAEKGSKAVSTVTSTEKGETITVIACCSAEGTFLPPACIMKGKNKKAEFEDGMPPGSRIFMSQKSAYITSIIFLEWLETHFVSRKPAGKVLLLLDGHSTHCNSVEMLEYAEKNDIVLLSMPSHTSHYLQPLDRAVFKSLKTHFYEQCRLWLKQNTGRRITRLSFGTLLNKAWGKAASAENAITGFKATGVSPFNPSAIPDYAFTQEPRELTSTSQKDSPATITDSISTNLEQVSRISEEPVSESVTVSEQTFCAEEHRISNANPEMFPKKSPTENMISSGSQVAAMLSSTSRTPPNKNDVPDLTPTRILMEISPVSQKVFEVRKRAKQVGTLLTSEEHIQMRKCKEDMKYAKRMISDSSGDEEQPVLCDTSDKKGEGREKENCVGCGENYFETHLIEDWLQCIICQLRLHENCTEFDNMCSKCGQRKKRELKLKKCTVKKEKQ